MAGWKTVRVFISSTFRDMHAERDHLVKVVFTALRESLLKDRIYLDDIDLRWGVTREQAENDRVLDLCLRQIDNCRPFFIGILGERYGWVPLKLSADACKNFGWIKDHAGKSVTELEILHGVLNDPAMNERAFFYLRDPAFIDDVPVERKQVFLESPTEQELRELSPEKAEACAEDRRRKLREVKAKIRARKPGLFVFDKYPCHWDVARPDPVTKQRGRLVGLEAFGESVREKLNGAIRTDPKLKAHFAALAAAPHDPFGLAEEQDYHERFMESRLRVYVGRELINDALLVFADGNDRVPCLVIGPSGSGKSAALARFVRDYRQKHPQTLVIPHFVGASPRSTNLRDILRRFCQVFKARFGFAEEMPEETAKLSVTFREFLSKVPADTRVLLVVDALNQLDETDRAQELYWLPAELPPQVKAIVSCITDSGKTEPVLEAFRSRKPPVEMADLSDAEQREIIRQVPSLSAKTLDDDQVRLLLSNPATANPLFLLVALEELRGFASYERLNERIAAFPREGDTVTAIFTQVIERLDEEFNKKLVERVLRLLASARRGLSERELQELVADLNGADDLFPVLRQLRPYLLSRAGLIDFYHRNLFKAVRERYLASDEQQRLAHARLAEYFHGQDYWLESLEEHQRRAKTLPPTPRPANVRKVDELPWHLFLAQAWQGLKETLADPQFFKQAWELTEHDILLYWKHIEAHSPFRLARATADMFTRPDADWGVLFQMTELLMRHGEVRGAAGVFLGLASHFQQTGDLVNAQAALGNAGIACFQLGDWDAAIAHFKGQERLAMRIKHPTGLANAVAGEAAVMASQGKADAAQALLVRVKELVRRTGIEIGSAHLGTEASLLLRSGAADAGLAKFQEQKRAAQVSERKDELVSCLGNMAVAANKADRLDEAEQCAREQEELASQRRSPEEVLRSLDVQASVAFKKGDYEHALELYRRQEPLCRQCDAESQLVKVLCMQANLLFLTTERTDHALHLTDEARQVADRLGENEQNRVHNIRAALLRHQRQHHT
jgi:tetratricopeptide (TPR) repeat protein